jgi:hypothetical protein
VADVAWLHVTGGRATVAGRRVAVVALLGQLEHSVAADLRAHTGLAGRRTAPAAFDLTNLRAAVAADCVAVVALLAGVEDAVAAIRRVDDDPVDRRRRSVGPVSTAAAFAAVTTAAGGLRGLDPGAAGYGQDGERPNDRNN